MNENLNPRCTVLEQAVRIENYITLFLAELLGIEINTSIVLSNSEHALPFISKVKIIMDLKIISNDDKNKLQKFAFIRNQFVHNNLASNYTMCFKAVGGTSKDFKKWYPTVFSDIESEENNQILCRMLYCNVIDIINEIQEKIYKKRLSDHIDQINRGIVDQINLLFSTATIDKDNEAYIRIMKLVHETGRVEYNHKPMKFRPYPY